MEPGDEQQIQVQRDLQHLTRTLNAENLNAEIMFAKNRGIRSCTPPFDSLPGNGMAVRERLKRVQPPPVE
jgi:hypothetical protein